MTWPVWKIISRKWEVTEEILKETLQEEGFSIQKRFPIQKELIKTNGTHAKIWILDYTAYLHDTWGNPGSVQGNWKVKLIQLQCNRIIVEADKSEDSLSLNINPRLRDLHNYIDEKLIKIVLKI